MVTETQLEQLFLWGTALSVATLLLVLVAVPWVVSRLPTDYFTSEQRPSWGLSSARPGLAVLVGLLKNAAGAVLVLLGLAMLLTPGQGLLTLLAGLLLMNFPGKYRLERLLVRQPGVLRALNWLRGKRRLPPFEAPADDGPAD